MQLTLAELAAQLHGELVGDGNLLVTGVSGYDTAAPGDLTFVDHARLLPAAEASRAVAVIAPRDATPGAKPLIRVDEPRLAFARALALFACYPGPAPGVHPTAILGQRVKVGAGCSVGPFVVIGDDVTLGEGTTVHSFVHIGDGVVIGRECVLHSSVSLYHHITLGDRVTVHSGTVIGSDGFGFVRTGDRYQKIPQIGTVIIGDDVEIGSNCSIDRATTEATVIGRGTKLDNLVQVAHNVRIGANCVIAAQVGISGSCTIEDGVTIAGQVGIADHLTIGAGAVLAAQAGIIGDVAPGQMVSGYPARPHRQQMRVHAAGQKLPEALVELRNLRARVEQLEQALAQRRE